MIILSRHNWTFKEDEYLANNYTKFSYQELAEHLNRSYSSVYGRIIREIVTGNYLKAKVRPKQKQRHKVTHNAMDDYEKRIKVALYYAIETAKEMQIKTRKKPTFNIDNFLEAVSLYADKVKLV